VTGPGAPCRHAWKRDGAVSTGQHCFSHQVPAQGPPLFPPQTRPHTAHPPKAVLPDVGDPFPVLRFPGPDGNLVSLGADVDDGPAHLIAVLVKHLPDEAQQLPGGEGDPRTVPAGARCGSRGNTAARTLQASPSGATLTVSSQKRSSSVCRCCLARVISQRPPRLFWLSSHMGSMPS